MADSTVIVMADTEQHVPPANGMPTMDIDMVEELNRNLSEVEEQINKIKREVSEKGKIKKEMSLIEEMTHEVSVMKYDVNNIKKGFSVMNSKICSLKEEMKFQRRFLLNKISDNVSKADFKMKDMNTEVTRNRKHCTENQLQHESLAMMVEQMKHDLQNVRFIRRFTWFLVIVLCVGVYTTVSSKAVAKYMSYPTLSNVEYSFVQSIEFPSFTICSNNLLKKSYYIEQVEAGNITAFWSPEHFIGQEFLLGKVDLTMNITNQDITNYIRWLPNKILKKFQEGAEDMSMYIKENTLARKLFFPYGFTQLTENEARSIEMTTPPPPTTTTTTVPTTTTPTKTTR